MKIKKNEKQNTNRSKTEIALEKRVKTRKAKRKINKWQKSFDNRRSIVTRTNEPANKNYYYY